MSLVRRDPFQELEDVSNRLNRFFGAPPQRPSEAKDAMTAFDWAPTVDVAESVEEFHIKADLAGVPKENVKVSVHAGVLRIEGERRQDKDEKGKRWHRVERSYGSFLRTFTLPENVDEGRVSAEFKDGLLSVRIPKAEKAKPKAIDIKVG